MYIIYNKLSGIYNFLFNIYIILFILYNNDKFVL